VPSREPRRGNRHIDVRKWRKRGGDARYAGGVTELDTRACDRARLARDPRFDGRFFIAVLSTGIYCRPICPSPTARRANVRFFKSAAEAVAAGFRPCLRCRPETAPGTPAWNGTSTTVARALRLITEGAFLTRGVGELSRRLGVSPRHLDRLFTSHLGASPAAVVRTWRLNYAKELISDTDLPMSVVAQAAGFGSVRRFNDSIRALYGRTPTALRKMRRRALRGGRGEYVFRVSYRPPFDWEWLLGFLADRAIPGVEEVVSGTYRRTFAHEGRHGILEVRHDEVAHSVEARVRFAHPLSLLPLVTRVRGMFDLSADAAMIAEHLGRDPALSPYVDRFPPPRVPGAWDGFELAVRAILGEASADAGASVRAGRIAVRHGEALSFSDPGGTLALVFPGASALEEAPLSDVPEREARAIRSVARAVRSGDVSFDADGEEALDRLAALPGIDESIAAYVAMRAMREPDAFPAGDLVVRRERGPSLSGAALWARAERWRPWRAYAAVYLWRAAAEDRRNAAFETPVAAPARRRESGRRGASAHRAERVSSLAATARR